jgi:hypothetical protein
MRAYAMLLGLALTTASGYAAQVAVSSVGTGRLEPATSAATVEPRDRLDAVWYGGVLDPVTIEAKGDSPSKTAAARRLLLDRSGAACPRSTRYSAVS